MWFTFCILSQFSQIFFGTGRSINELKFLVVCFITNWERQISHQVNIYNYYESIELCNAKKNYLVTIDLKNTIANLVSKASRYHRSIHKTLLQSSRQLFRNASSPYIHALALDSNELAFFAVYSKLRQPRACVCVYIKQARHVSFSRTASISRVIPRTSSKATVTDIAQS